MQVLDDMELVREYAATRSEQAFAAIVSRHINLVYSVALRHAGNAHEAQDITQSVFVVLAKKAASLRQGTVLSGWLFQAARMTASNFLRTEARRMHREQEAYMRSTLNEAENGDAWKQVAPLLDAAIADLGEKDRNAIVLRYVEGKDLKEVGVALGATEDAAKKRVSRAVEKLRGFFSKRGVMLSSAALAGAISANAVKAAPAGMAAIITAGAIQGAGTTATSWVFTKGALKLMAWTKVKIAVGVGVAALVAYQWHQNDVATKQIATLQQDLKDAGDTAAKQQAVIDKLKQEKLAMVDEKAAAEKASARLLAHQRTAFNAAEAKNIAAARNEGKSNSLGGALGAMMDDPAMKEMMRQQQLTALKAQYAPLIKSLNLSPDAADKFIQLLSDNAMKNMDRGMAYLKGDVDPAAIRQAQLADKNELASQMQSLLGADGYTQYEQFAQEVPARTLLTLLKGQMGDNPLSEDQSAKLLDLMKAGPSIDNSSDPNPSQDAMEKMIQQQADDNQRVLQKAADFLSPDQLASLGTFQTNMIGMERMGMNMKAKFLSKQ
jgi:RNA polymerase sigma factor (sigma-70 family)